jgi:hypothetical protein
MKNRRMFFWEGVQNCLRDERIPKEFYLILVGDSMTSSTPGISKTLEPG